MNLTYIRTLNSAILNKFIVLSVIKRIVTFYYNLFIFHPNIFKNFENKPINNTEHKNCLEFLKIAGSSNINFIY